MNLVVFTPLDPNLSNIREVPVAWELENNGHEVLVSRPIFNPRNKDQRDSIRIISVQGIPELIIKASDPDAPISSSNLGYRELLRDYGLNGVVLNCKVYSLARELHRILGEPLDKILRIAATKNGVESGNLSRCVGGIDLLTKLSEFIHVENFAAQAVIRLKGHLPPGDPFSLKRLCRLGVFELPQIAGLVAAGWVVSKAIGKVSTQTKEASVPGEILPSALQMIQDSGVLKYLIITRATPIQGSDFCLDKSPHLEIVESPYNDAKNVSQALSKSHLFKRQRNNEIGKQTRPAQLRECLRNRLQSIIPSHWLRMDIYLEYYAGWIMHAGCNAETCLEILMSYYEAELTLGILEDLGPGLRNSFDLDMICIYLTKTTAFSRVTRNLMQ